MHFHESTGRTLSREGKSKRELDHLRVYAGPDSTADKPMWLVEHHASPHDRNPESHTFEDGHEMLRHIAEHANVPPPEDEEK